MRKIIILFQLLILFFSCKKEDKIEYDYRTKYEGIYNFNIHHSEYMYGHGTYFDTTYSKDGFIKIFGSKNDSLLKIHYGIDTFGIINSMGNVTVISEFSAYKVLTDNSLRFPFDMGSSLMFSGYFKGADTVDLFIRFGGLGAWSIREIKGYKKNNNR